MPEKPKRRKNNKNKRKNKNVRIDPNTSSGGTKSDVDTCFNEIKDDTENKGSVVSTFEENKLINLPEATSSHTEMKSDDKGKNIQIDSLNKKVVNSPVEHKNISEENQDNSLVLEETYVVESPDQYIRNAKLSNGKKSKSVDDDESLRIVEITEESSPFPENNKNSVLVLDVDSDIKWENTSELESNLPQIEEPLTGTVLSPTTIPLKTAHCEQAKLLSPEEELSLRHYLQSLNLASNPSTSLEIKTEIEKIINSEIKHRLRKKGLAEDVFVQRLGPPRILDVIDEEGSGESSFQSRRHSYLSDKKSDNDELEDEVFENPCNISTSGSNNIKLKNTLKDKTSFQQIPQQCLLVGAKLKEPDISEARGNWTVQTVEKMTGAEFVYLTDSSSSTSSIYDIGEDIENGEDTDVSVRMITPTIEVTDTENLLKKTFETTENTDTDEHKTPIISVSMPEEFNSKSTSSNKIEKSHKIISNIEQRLHEVVVESTDNIKTNLTVKDLDNTEKNKNNDSANTSTEKNTVNSLNDYDLEMKVLKCELNDAINNLIKEVSDSESISENSKDTFTRQDSSSSMSSSQCTAIYNPSSSFNDVPNSTNVDFYHNNNDFKEYSKDSLTKSHVQDVIECVTKKVEENSIYFDNYVKQPQKLRDICVNKISSFPYGLKILEELANVSLRLHNLNTVGSELVENIYSSTNNKKDGNHKADFISNPMSFTVEKKLSEHQVDLNSPPPRPPPPPPIQPRNSSMKKSQENHQFSDVPVIKPPYVCLSPSQKMLMEKTNTVVKENNSNVKDINSKNFDSRNEQNLYWTENASTKPFKSKTGSRLMALICDPALSNSISSKINKFEDKQNIPIQNTIEESVISSMKYNDQQYQPLNKNTFKPVPPPRPKKNLSSYYESDENSDFVENSFKSMKKERKIFHFSTGNLSKEIEDDISTIQNMHKNYMNIKEQNSKINSPRRPSLPKDLCDQQMEYIRQKEKEVEAEICRLEAEKKSKPLIKKGPRAPMIVEKETNNVSTQSINHKLSTKGMLWNTHQKVEKNPMSSLFSSSQEEILREKMYSEYLNEIAEREQRKHHKVIKITNTPKTSDLKSVSKSMSALDVLDSKVNNRIEEEFISKARERWNKLGIMDPESEDERYNKNVYREPKIIQHKIKVIDDGEEKDVRKLPSHLQEFVTFTAKDNKQESGSSGESDCEEKPTHVVILCAVMLLVLAIGRYVLRLLRNV